MRPHHRRAATPLILSIEREAAKPGIEALRAADIVLARLGELDPAEADETSIRELVERARAAHDVVERILAAPD